MSIAMSRRTFANGAVAVAGAAALSPVLSACGGGKSSSSKSGGNSKTGLASVLLWHSRHKVQPTFATLDYFDGVHFAQRATAPALFSVALMDPICPPSTVYAAFNHHAGVDRTIAVWPFAGHGGGYGSTPGIQLAWLRERGLAPGATREDVPQ